MIVVAVLLTIVIAVVLTVVVEGVAKRLERLDLLFYFILLVLGKEKVRRELHCGLRLRLGQICGRLGLTCSSSISRRLWTR